MEVPTRVFQAGAHFSAPRALTAVSARGLPGEGDARESDSQVLYHPNSMHALAFMDKHSRHLSRLAPPPPTTTIIQSGEAPF